MSVQDEATHSSTPIASTDSPVFNINRPSERRLVALRRWSVLWALLPVLSFGLATPFLIGFAAARLKSKKLAIAALGWALAEVGFWIGVSAPIDQQGWRAGTGNLLVGIVIVGGTFHTSR